MNNTITQAEQQLLHPADLDIPKTQAILMNAAAGLDWADIYLQRQIRESWRIEDSAVKTGSYTDNRGVGLRALHGETTAFAGSDIISAKSIGEITQVAKTAKTYGGDMKKGDITLADSFVAQFSDDNPILLHNDDAKIALLQKIDKVARATDSRVENVIAGITSAYDIVLILRSDGGLAADIRPMVRLSVSVIIHDKGKRESGNAGGGGRTNLAYFDDKTISRIVGEAVEEAVEKLDAKPAPAGEMPVVLGPGWAGVILHEAVGHGLEGDFNRKKQSAFSGRIGEKVAAEGVSVVDAGNINGRRGSLSVDDEGTPSQETVLIENGILRGYMQDIANAGLMNAATTGNGRRESYAHPPMPRMTNTFMPAGKYDPEDIISSVKRGLYADNFSGGEVDITNGNFVFVASRARLIENGKLGATVKGATIIGNGPAIMPLVSMVGNDFSLDPGVGNCGKNGQWVPVGVGQPTIKVDSLNVGGEGG
ncbi:MAG: metalloprotease TldD [Gammaproteobacteria bacterium WSBS_2016_MAG_OTU1]